MRQKTNMELMKMRTEHVPQGPFNVTPIFVKRARGALIEDVEGNEYIDFGGGIGVVNVGHCNERVVSAVKDQAEQYLHTCFHISMYEPYVELAKRLNEITPGEFRKKTFFVNSGAEAVENAVKIARYATKRQGIIAFENAFHGRTYMAMTLTSKVKPYKFGFGPFCPEVYRMPFAYCYRCPFDGEYPSCGLYCADHLEDFFIGNVAAESVAAIIAEPIQGEGGFVVPPPGYFKKIKAVCERNGILFIMDEVQTGIGRTGKLFASEHYEVVPDIILTAKSLAAGLPLAGVTGRAEIVEAPHVGGLGGTYGGNPVSCAAALAVLDLLDTELLQKARELGEKVRTRFLEFQEEFEIIGDVRGLGPMIGMELVKNRGTKEPAADKAKELANRCLAKGLIILACGNYGNVIRTLMPLVITDEQLERGCSILRDGLSTL
ncbi:MAG: 4-aminobutyrate--2-oxoglutarate transaminase [Deltaproteobacteria bacterium]|nr:4-aminobutyrate--2-oxoglutarate transaminase [Deltaproteobacteria bacterium]MBW2112609.1 4-aminobutyrate--2-oxoglutarate transaminase [Deltaproteobacteria bacterium]